MSRASAWNIRDVGQETREAAEEAARRAGVSLSEWLNYAIAEQAAEQGVDRADFYRQDRSERISERLSHLERTGDSVERRGLSGASAEDQPAEASSFRERKRIDERLKQAIAKLEMRVAVAQGRAARPLDSVGDLIDRSRGRAPDERQTLEAAANRLDPIEERIAGAQDGREPASRPIGLREHESAATNEEAARELDDRMSQLARRIDATERGRQEAQGLRPRLDFAQAVSDIARRRQALDAGRGHEHSGAGLVSKSPASDGAVAAPSAEARPALGARADADIGVELRRLNRRLEEIGRNQTEHAAPYADVAALRAELSAMSRALADLAPRNAVVGIEGAVRDLSDRVASLQDRDLRESLAKPVEESVAAIRETLRAHDPREAVANLDRDIRTIAAKVDALANSQIDPESFDRIRRHTEDVRDLLNVAALRPMPVDRLERQIGELADRIDRLTMSQSPGVDSARVVASLIEARQQIERSTPAAALNLIERRLEALSAKMDQALTRSQPSSAFPKALEELARRIDGVRESLETRQPLPIASASLEATMRELSAKLHETQAARLDPQLLGAWMREVNAKLETARPVSLNTEPLERWMRELAERLDNPASRPIDSAALESLIRSLQERLDRPAPAADTAVLESMVRGLQDKFDDARERDRDPPGLSALQRQVARIDERLDADLSAINSLGRVIEHVSAQLDETREALLGAASLWEQGKADDGAERRIDSLRATQEASERRVQSTLTGVHGMLEKLVERMARVEDEVVRLGEPELGAPLRASKSPKNALPEQTTVVEAPEDDTGPSPVSVIDLGPERAAGPALPRLGEGSDFLIEPGAGAPARAFEKDANPAPPKTAVNAHIAAARRAAQAANAEASLPRNPSEPETNEDRRRGPRGLGRASAFLNARRRPILLGLAFIILGTIAVIEMGARFQSNALKSEMAAPAASASKIAIAPPANDPPLDITPTGAIASTPTPAAPSQDRQKSVAAPLDLVALIPSATPQALRDLAAAGDPAAECELGSRLAEGRDMPRDLHLASQWVERAALQGFAPAEYRLGAFYEKGNGVERDLPLAKAWYQKAAIAGNIKAMYNLAVLAADAAGGKPDYAEAFNWFQKAARFGVKDSQYNLAILYARGLGASQDFNQSWFWFSLAAEQGDTDAAKKRDEVALKLDSGALAAGGAALAAFQARAPDPVANDVKAPDGGWDAKAPSQATERKPPKATPL